MCYNEKLKKLLNIKNLSKSLKNFTVRTIFLAIQEYEVRMKSNVKQAC